MPVVYNSVGKDTLMASLDSLQPRGTLVSNGTTSGPVILDTHLLAIKGSLWVTRPAMIHYMAPRAHMLEMAKDVFDLVLAGKIMSEPSRKSCGSNTPPRPIVFLKAARQPGRQFSFRNCDRHSNPASSRWIFTRPPNLARDQTPTCMGAERHGLLMP